MMTMTELRQQTADDLMKELLQAKRDQFNLRVQQKTGQLTKPHLVSQLRKYVAQIMTLIKEKEEG